MAKSQFGYKYKSSATRLFQPPKLVDKQQDTIRSLASQERSLTRRFNQVGQPLPQETDGQLGLLAEITGEKSKQEVDKRNLLQKALNVKADQGVVMDILEVLDRPRQVVANMISSIGNEDERNLLQAAWDGLSGRKRISTKEALQKMVGDDEFLEIAESEGWGDEVGNFIIDLGLDILSDPTTYICWKFITAPLGGAAKWAGKSLVELGDAGLKSTSKIAQAFGNFVDTVRKGANNIKFYFDAKAGLPEWLVKRLEQIDPGLGEQARKLKLSIYDLRKTLNEVSADGDRLYYALLESDTVIKKVGKAIQITTPDTTLKLKTVVNDMYENFTKKGIKAYAIPELARQTTRNQNQVANFAKKLNDFVGRKVFRYKVSNGQIALEITQDFTTKEFDTLLLKLQQQANNRIPGSVLRSQITFKGALLDTPEMKQFIENIGVDNLNKKLLQGKSIIRQSRQLLSDMGTYKIGSEVLPEGTRYARRVITQEGKDFIAQRSPFVRKPFIKPGKDILTGRTFTSTMLSSEINKATKELYGAANNIFNESAVTSLNDLVNVSVQKYTQREVLQTLLGVKVQRAGVSLDSPLIVKQIQQVNFFSPISENTNKALAEQIPENFRALTKGTIDKEFSKLYNNLPDEFKALWQKMLNKAGAAGDQIAMHKSVYNVLKNLDNAYREVPEFLKAYDGFINMWKEVNLLSPAFNLRNFIGNMTNMYLGGMPLPSQMKYTTQAWFDLGKYDKLIKKQALDPYNISKTLTPDELKFIDEVGAFYREGISQSYKNTRDLDTILQRIEKEKAGLIKPKKGVAKVYGSYVETNFKMAEKIDNMQRYALWKYHKDLLAKTAPGALDNGFKAAQKVRESLFDYTNLTSFEKDYMKRLIPFYTFFKNNLAFQAKNLVKNPGQYTKMLRAYKYWGEDIADLGEKDVPEYMSGNMWIPIPLTIEAGDQEKIAFLKANLPFSDFTEFIDQPLRKGLGSVTVPIKLLWELGSEKELFTGAPIEQFPGQQKRMEDPEGKVWLDEIRGKNGEIYLSGDPTIQKIADELGLRTPRRLISSILDIVDAATGAQTTEELVQDIFERAGVTDTKTRSDLELNALYQRVEELRNLKKLYEQNVGELPFSKQRTKLPPLPKANVSDRSAYLYRPK